MRQRRKKASGIARLTNSLAALLVTAVLVTSSPAWAEPIPAAMLTNPASGDALTTPGLLAAPRARPPLAFRHATLARPGTSPAQTGTSSAEIRAALLFAPEVRFVMDCTRREREDLRSTGTPVDSSLAAAGSGPGETGGSRRSFEKGGDDPWFAVDKAQHLAFSFLWTLGTQYAIVNKVGLSERRALPLSISASALVGLAKELYDLRMGPPHVFSFRDLAANAVGILLATGFILL